MKTITSKNHHDSSCSFSRRHFNCKKKFEEDDDEDDKKILTLTSSSSHSCDQSNKTEELRIAIRGQLSLYPSPRKKLPAMAITKLRSALGMFVKNYSAYNHSGLGYKVIGTLFGHRKSRVHFAFQEEPRSKPAFLIQLATQTNVLVREMASGWVRIALECEKRVGKKGMKLADEPVWRSYCNGKKCGFAIRRECGDEEWKVLKAVEPITMGAGVLPGNGNGDESEGEMMYMRARFERVVGSRDSEAFYMMNLVGTGGPELSIYLLRV